LVHTPIAPRVNVLSSSAITCSPAVGDRVRRNDRNRVFELGHPVAVVAFVSCLDRR
jgi:hypothetical protein